MSRWHGIAGGATVGGDVSIDTVDTATTVAVVTVTAAPADITVAVAAITTSRAAGCCGVSGNGAGGAWQRGAVCIVGKGFVQSLNRWHGVTDGMTVGGDVHTVTVAIITTKRAARYCGVGDDGASGA